MPTPDTPGRRGAYHVVALVVEIPLAAPQTLTLLWTHRTLDRGAPKETSP